ncbi:DUF6134 family protein [Sediminicoccus rosea]|jgi:hypothetical protein|uniref:DUF6134 family protein n=1 Tax=Sediminicoccus rosea TaxID=1225128 RepID=A0ABZ0PN08_9PROT|nr:DUF6134 family protein [Sediminicoccus rosea]WPB87120.1 DUF6134 family protein [Sediminicoccus rosea]
MIARRNLPMLLAPLAAGPALAQAPADYRWRVMRNGTAIGTHNISFTERGGERITVSENLVTPRVMGVVVFRYEHRLTEVSRGGRFVSVRSSLNRNGAITEVEAQAGAQGVTLRGPEGALNLPAQAVPLAWWEPQRFGGSVPLFGTTTGKPLDLRWTREALGQGVRWRTAGEIEAVLEFDASGRWTAYQVKGDDGSTVIYAAA